MKGHMFMSTKDKKGNWIHTVMWGKGVRKIERDRDSAPADNSDDGDVRLDIAMLDGDGAGSVHNVSSYDTQRTMVEDGNP